GRSRPGAGCLPGGAPVPPLLWIRRARGGDPVHVPRLPAPGLPVVASHRPLPGAAPEVRDRETGAVTASLEVHDLRVEFGGVRAVRGVSFSVPSRQITGLIGPNGAGKSTVLKLMAGALRPTGGRILYEGRDVTGRPPYSLARLGLIRTFQLSSEFARLTVTENLLVAAPGQRATTFRGALLGKRYWRGQQAELVETARGLLREFDMSDKADEY